MAPHGVDATTFTSSSTVTNLARLLGEDIEPINRTVVACIGPITAKTARDRGIRVDVVAKRQTIEGLVESLVEYFEGRQDEMNMGNPVNFARLRRNRSSDAVRSLVAETRLRPCDFVYPMFVTGGSGVKQPIGPMPGCYQLSVDEAVKSARNRALVGHPRRAVVRDCRPGRTTSAPQHGTPMNRVQRAVAEIRSALPELAVITDVCMCEYTSHGHCGMLEQDGSVDNDRTLPLLAKTAVSHARSGRDYRGPISHDGRPGGGHPVGVGR